jgi:hypothetical protein
LPKCQFTIQYYDYETHKEVDFNCTEEDPLASGRCIFHDKDYLPNKTNNEEHKRKVLESLKHKVNYAISNNEPLLCIGFHLPDFSLSDLSINKNLLALYISMAPSSLEKHFFAGDQFHGQANFLEAKFQEVSFYGAHFLRLADFGTANF